MKMANTEGMKMKYTVLKNSEVQSHVPGHLLDDLALISNTVKQARVKKGKKENTYLVINTDEPYADEVIEIMKRHGHWG
jgi:hypothetical protein